MSDTKYTLFTKRIAFLVGSICIVSVLFAGIVFLFFYNYQLRKVSELAVKNTNIAITNSLNLYYIMVSDKLSKDLDLYQRHLDRIGELSVDLEEFTEKVIISQESKQLIRKTFPTLKIGGKKIDRDLLGYINKTTGDSACLYQLTDNKLLRILATCKLNDAKSNLDVFIDENSPIYQNVIVKGERYITKYLIEDSWTIIQYAPLRDKGGHIVGASSVGYPLLTDPLKKLINDAKLGNSCFHIYDSKGNIIIHPLLSYDIKIFDAMPELKGRKDEIVRYNYQGIGRTNYVSYLPEWDLYAGLAVQDRDIVWNYTWEMLFFVLIVWIVIIAGSSLVIYREISALEEDIDDFRDRIKTVTEDKNYKIKFPEDSVDDEYETAIYMNRMVHSLDKQDQQIKLADKMLDFSASTIRHLSSDLKVCEEVDDVHAMTKNQILIFLDKLCLKSNEISYKLLHLANLIDNRENSSKRSLPHSKEGS